MPHHHRHHQRQRQRDGQHYRVNGGDTGRVEARQRQPEIATVISVVYKTASQTFAGPVAGYTTFIPPAIQSTVQLNPEDTPASTQLPQATETPTQQSPTSVVASSILSALQPQSSYSAVAVSSATTLSAIASPPSAISRTDTDLSSSSKATSLLHSEKVTMDSTLATAMPTQTIQFTTNPAVAASASQASNSNPASVTKPPPQGLTNGAKAGIAIGIILALAALIALLAFCYRRRSHSKRETNENVENEKNPFGDNAATCTPPRTSTLPQLNLKHMTHFDPQLAGPTKNSNGSAMPTPTTATALPHDLEKDQDRTGQPANPFDEHADSSDSASRAYVLKRDSSMLAQQAMPAPLRIRTPTPESAAAVSPVASAASATIAQRHNAPKPLDIKRAVSPAPRGPIEGAAPSPALTEFSMTSIPPGSMNNGGGTLLPNVHRIQLDFKPSMEDELELRAGQLVRLLHEYDDGWALCIRLDRSQQGVAPRTCLSTRPVKPRSNGPPRGAPAPCMLRSQEQHSISPVGGLGSPKPSSQAACSTILGPNQRQRSKSPGPYGGGPPNRNEFQPGIQRRRNSVGDVPGKKNSFVEPSRMNSNPGLVAQAMQGAQRVPVKLQAVTPPALTPPQTPHSMQRKPVPGQVA
ncbi:MAG: hypothetical protein Q9187_000452 [Circinaria calcarea]